MPPKHILLKVPLARIERMGTVHSVIQLQTQEGLQWQEERLKSEEGKKNYYALRKG